MILDNGRIVLFTMIIQATCVTEEHTVSMRLSTQRTKNRRDSEEEYSRYPDYPNLQYIACYECSSFPPEEDSQDEPLGSCPGWKREPKKYPLCHAWVKGPPARRPLSSSIYSFLIFSIL